MRSSFDYYATLVVDGIVMLMPAGKISEEIRARAPMLRS